MQTYSDSDSVINIRTLAENIILPYETIVKKINNFQVQKIKCYRSRSEKSEVTSANFFITNDIFLTFHSLFTLWMPYSSLPAHTLLNILYNTVQTLLQTMEWCTNTCPQIVHICMYVEHSD